jgi:2-isopropylmalate synthase
MIHSSVVYLKAQGKTVIYDAEHFFDGYRADADYALATLEAAVAGGAERLVLCDTNGGSLPEVITTRVREACERFKLIIGIHAHNDCELGVANSLAAVSAGASHVQGTINGYGERCGNANLTSIMPNLQLKLGFEQPQRLEELKDLSRLIDDRANLHPNFRAAFVGEAAFAHKGGIHVSAVNKNPETYEHIVPERVGNKRRILLSDLSGRANVLAKAIETGDDGAGVFAKDVVERIKELENQGYAFESADASYQLLTKKVSKEYQPYFILHGYRVDIDKRDEDQDPVCEASIKVEVGGELEHTAADGDGPVNALGNALEKALTRFYPSIKTLELIDYKVRVLSGVEKGTASVVRVEVKTTDGDSSWGTVGASTNIIDASYEALIDAIEYKFLKDKVVPKATIAV